MATGKRKHVAEVMFIALSLLLSWFWQQAMARINIRVSHNARRKRAVINPWISGQESNGNSILIAWLKSQAMWSPASLWRLQSLSWHEIICRVFIKFLAKDINNLINFIIYEHTTTISNLALILKTSCHTNAENQKDLVIVWNIYVA